MGTILRKELEVDRRMVIQGAKLAIRDVFDAIVELVTNADDRYQVLGGTGKIEIEVERHRGRPSILKVRDFADGMTSSVMEEKLSRMGGRVSGMEAGLAVRGTNSRGAKDVAALGPVEFQSIPGDGNVHTCRITPFFEFELEEPRRITEKLRKELGIARGSGTLVTINVAPSQYRIPRHERLVEQVSSLVRLRDILGDPKRSMALRDLKNNKTEILSAPPYDGHERLSQRFAIPGYEGVDAKMVIYRSRVRFDRGNDRFRRGGVLVKSRHAIHEATLFDSALESDPNALWFFGRLTCEALDDLWNEFDERTANNLSALESNPVPILDPSRKSGLTRDHPFVTALYQEARKRLRPLVEEERKREENARSKVESRGTRRRLDALEKAANQFMEDNVEEEDTARDPDDRVGGSHFRKRGFLLSPPFAQIVKGHSRRCWLSVSLEAFPEIETGLSVQIEALSPEIVPSRRFVSLEAHPAQEGVLRATWTIEAVERTAATGLSVRAGPIFAESTIEVFDSEADVHAHVKSLEFQRSSYRVRTDGQRKKVRLLAPADVVAAGDSGVHIEVDGKDFKVNGQTILKVNEKLQVGICDFTVQATREDAKPTSMRATLGNLEAMTTLVAVEPEGASIQIRLEDVDHGAMRYHWKKNELEIAARHPSLSRYLGPKAEKFPGQEDRHFRVLLAEIVADAACSQLLRQNIRANPADYENADWDQYYAEFSEYMTEFLPKAHALVLPNP